MNTGKAEISKIVVVEDDNGLNKLLQKKLQRLSFEIVGFCKGEEAVSYIKKNKDVFLLVDYHLSGMLAIELINELKENGIFIPFIVMTGRGDEKLAVEMMRQGALDYVVKEVGFYKNIDAIIRRAINHHETKSRLAESQKQIALSEEKYRSIFENIHDIYFETGVDGKITEISPSSEKILQYKRNKLIGKTIQDFFVDKNQGVEFLELILKKNNVVDYEALFKTESKNNIYGSISAGLKDSKDNTKKIIGIIRDVTLRKKLENQILTQVIETEERERKRFSEDLHDGLGPLLASIKIYVNMIITSELDGEKRLNLIRYTNDLIDEAISSTRAIANNLMPNVLNDYGLVKGIESFVKKINLTEKIEVVFKSNFERRLSPNVEIILYRTMLELIHNTIKHAKATKIFINLHVENNLLKIKYIDNGVGFDVNKPANKKGNGIRNITNRMKSINAKINFLSEKNKGLEVNIEIDINNHKK